MAGIISGKYSTAIKIIYIVFTVLSLLIFIDSFIGRILIDYSNVYPFMRYNGIENSVLYTVLGIEAIITFIFLLIFHREKLQKNVKSAIVFFVSILIIFIGSAVISSNVVKSETYESADEVAGEVSDYFPISNFDYKNKSKDYYFCRKVKLPDAYWVGSYSQKEFIYENPMESLTVNEADTTVSMNYYFLKDTYGYRIKEIQDKRDWHDVFSSMSSVDEIKEDDYCLYVYDNSYEFVICDESSVFCLTASKNSNTEYTKEDVIKLSKNVYNYLLNSVE